MWPFIKKNDFNHEQKKSRKNACIFVLVFKLKLAEKKNQKKTLVWSSNEGACYETDLIREMDGRKGGMLLSRLFSSSLSRPLLFTELQMGD